MTESESPRVAFPPITVWPVTPGDPPYRLVQIHGEVAGMARSLVDVLEYANAQGLHNVDLDDPAVTRWVGGDKFTWSPRPKL